MQSFVRWAGSKRLLINELAGYWRPDANRYVEPFAGSACLFFHIAPRAALIADLNAELIAMYRELQRDAELVLECFRRLRRGESSYYSIRKQDPARLAPAEAAARFLYLNRYCFNGLFRTNQKGTFNVPYGPPKKPLKCFEDRVRTGASLLKAAELRAADFQAVIHEVAEGDFVYLDPPYASHERRLVFNDYLPHSFSAGDIGRLADALHHIDSVRASFLLSYSDSPEAAKLKRRWKVKRVTSRRNIAGFVGARKLAREILVTNMV